MPPIVDFYPFADAAGANVIDQATWAAGNLSQGQIRDNGFLGGTIAESQEANKAWRQSTFVAAAIANLIAQVKNVDVHDDGNLQAFIDELKAAIAALSPSARKPVIPGTSTSDFFIATNGSDANGDGSAASPWATLQKAWNTIISTLDFAGNVVTIHVADGVYTTPLYASGVAIGATALCPVIITGNAGNAGAVVFNVIGGNCIEADIGAALHLQHVTVESTISGGIGGAGLATSFSGFIEFVDVTFLACTFAHMFVTAGSRMRVLGNYSIAGPSETHAHASLGSYLDLSNVASDYTVSISGTPNFSWSFVTAEQGSVIYAPRNIYSGGATGLSYIGESNGIIDTGGHGAGYFPGNQPGLLYTGAQYV
jgi:hypothetical protein